MMGTILDAALRSLVAAAAVGAGLHLLRVRNVLAQKVAWGMVLAAALAMPLLLSAVAHWQVARFVVHADPMTLLEELQAHIRTKSAAQPAAAPATQAVAGPAAVEPAVKPRPAEVPKVEPRESTLEQPGDDAALRAASVLATPEMTAASAPAAKAGLVAPTPHFQLPPPATLAVLAYAAIVLVLLGRLLYGLVAALALSRRATPVALAGQPEAERIHLRVSTQVASPVTIGSSILLPADYVEWDAEKLRIVLAHEGSHIRQGDFYLQLIAGVHAALFWFSPLGWWLRRKLSDLAEAISDRAGLAQAASRAAYAQVLLEFAAVPRPTQLGVAMARQGKLTRRIERLLNESTFREAYAGTRRRALAAVLLVPAAVFLATSMIRVEAAGHTQEPAAPPTAAAAAPAVPDAAAAPAAPSAPAEVREGQSVPPPEGVPSAPSAASAPEAMPAPPAASAVPDAAAAPLPPNRVVIVDSDDEPVVLDSDEPRDAIKVMPHAHSIIVRKDDDGDSYMIVHGNGQVSVDGKAENEALQKARKMAHGDFVLYTHQGKSYLIDDPATVEQIESAMGPMHMLAFKAKMLGDQNRAMVEMQRKFADRQKEFAEKQKTIVIRQRDLLDKQEAIQLTAPELKKQMQELNETVARLEARQDKKLSEKDLAELRSEVAELQAKLSSFPMHFEFQTVEMPKIEIPKIDFDKQLAEAQRQVVEAQERMQKESDEKMKSIIDQSLKDGKAKPIQ